MVNLLERSRKKKRVILVTSLVLLGLSAAEIIMIYQGKPVQNISLITGLAGLLGVVLLQASYFLERRFLVKNVVQNLVDKKVGSVQESVGPLRMRSQAPLYR